MIVTKVSGRRFARWEDVAVELPACGVVLVTGKNGHGKSTIVEAVAQGVWGQSVRGKAGWRTGAQSGVEVEFEGGHARRSVSKSKHILKWRVGEHGASEFPTRTKSQEALASHVGSFTVWRHACTFHTRDASRFSDATDLERKRLLEEVLELDRVEQAYRRAREELKAAHRGVTEAEHALAVRTTELAGHRQTREAMAGELEDVPDLEELRVEARILKAKVTDLGEELDRARAARIKAATARASVDGVLRGLHQRRQRIDGLGAVCPTCDQEVEPTHREQHIAELDAEISKHDAERVTHENTVAKVDHLLEQLVAEERAAQEAYQDNVRRGREAVATQKRNEARAAKLATIDSDIATAEGAVLAAEEQVTAATVRRDELTAVADVLSYQGVRAALLSAAVRSLEDLANDWLARLGLDGLAVRLSSQSSTQAGKVTDKISFDVEGAGGGLGYLAASTGEQRRIDIAMLLAIGELAADSRGLSPASTLFVDELFDGLDDDGLECAVTMLRDLAATRCVVVITHHAGLVSRLAPDLHLVAKDGALSGKVG